MFRRYGSTSNKNDNEDDGGSHELDVARCDHYASYQDDHLDDDNAGGNSGGLTPLTGRKRKPPKKSSSDNFTCCFSTRKLQKPCSSSFGLLLLLLLALATVLSIYYSYRLQLQITSLSSQISTLAKNSTSLAKSSSSLANQVKGLNVTVEAHSKIIARFENSVSNSDVLEKLAVLEEDWKSSREELEGEMEDTKVEIRGVLETTTESIAQTVSQAQNEINTQVQTVQSTLSTYIRTTQDQFSTENSFMIYQLAGTFTLLGCLISMWHMTSHLRHFQQPFVQRKILAILWMCPIYSVTSWLSLVLPDMEGYLAIFKDLYEAYVIYQFLSFCIAVLGKGDRTVVVDLLARHADHLAPPIRCFGWCRRRNTYNNNNNNNNNMKKEKQQQQMVERNGQEEEDEELDEQELQQQRHQLAEDVLLQCQVFAMQFVFLRPFLTAVLFVLKKIDYYGPMFGVIHFHIGNFTVGEDENGNVLGGDEDDEVGVGMMGYRSPQFYLVILENISVFLAFSGLLKFYHAVQEDLSWCRPFPKFLCIKGVVFMTFWQGIAISLLADTSDILSSGGNTGGGGEYSANDQDQEKWAKQAQNFLICLEMLGFAIAHFYCFPVEEWEPGYRPKEVQGKFGDNMALGDFLHDLKLILRHNEKKKQMAKLKGSNGKPNSDDSITTVLEEDEELGSSGDGLQSLLGNEDDAGDDSSTRNNTVATPLSSVRKARKSIQESLEAMDAPMELRKATALLLQCSLLDEDTSRLLANDILDQSLDEHEADEGCLVKDSHDDDGKEQEDSTLALGEDGASGYGATSTLEAGESQPLSSDEPCADGNAELETESSSLLPTSSKNEELLKPSIFTMQSSLGESS